MLTPKQNETLSKLDTVIFTLFERETTGHDYYHIKRVVDLTTRLMSISDPELYLALLIAYSHDIFDDKTNPTQNLEQSLKDFYSKHNLDLEGMEDAVIAGVKQIGYKGGFGVKEKTHAAQYVSDADILDAMGAVGIARTFYYAGSKGHIFHDPTLKTEIPDTLEAYRSSKRNPIAHFNEKLLLLKDWVKTPQGIVEASKRHQILLDFYQQFIEEVEL